MIVDRSVTAQHGDIVIAQVQGGFTVKELVMRPQLQLLPRNKAYSPISFAEGSEVELFGVVTGVVRQMRRG